MLPHLTQVVGSDAGTISSLLDGYLGELSAHRTIPVGATDSSSYPYIDAYWSEPGHHAFVIKCGGRAVGFAFVRDPTSTGSGVYQLAEFYVEPESRRLGIGRRTALSIWKRFPGDWELQVHSRNSGAVRFWRSCIESATGGPAREREVQAQDGPRLQFDLRVKHATF